MRTIRARWIWALQQLTGGRREGRQPFDVDLERDATWSALVARPGVALCCESGLVLVTAEGDRTDHVLDGGAAMALDVTGRVAVWALEPARLRVTGRVLSRQAPKRASAARTPTKDSFDEEVA